MSTMQLSARALANVAVVAAGDPRTEYGRHKLETYVSHLSRYAVANAAAYNHEYGDRHPAVEPASGADIRFHAMNPAAWSHSNRADAVSTFRLLRYNLQTNKGQDFLTQEIADALLAVGSGLLSSGS